MKTYWFRTAHLSKEQLSSIMEKLEENGEEIGRFSRKCLGTINYLVRRPKSSGGFVWATGSMADPPYEITRDAPLVEIHLEGV